MLIILTYKIALLKFGVEYTWIIIKIKLRYQLKLNKTIWISGIFVNEYSLYNGKGLDIELNMLTVKQKVLLKMMWNTIANSSFKAEYTN